MESLCEVGLCYSKISFLSGLTQNVISKFCWRYSRTKVPRSIRYLLEAWRPRSSVIRAGRSLAVVVHRKASRSFYVPAYRESGSRNRWVGECFEHRVSCRILNTRRPRTAHFGVGRRRPDIAVLLPPGRNTLAADLLEPGFHGRQCSSHRCDGFGAATCHSQRKRRPTLPRRVQLRRQARVSEAGQPCPVGRLLAR